MDIFSPRHLLIILLIVLVVFGTKKLRTIGSDLGSAVKGFKDSMKSGEAEAHAESSPSPINQLGGGAHNTDTSKDHKTDQTKV